MEKGYIPSTRYSVPMSSSDSHSKKFGFDNKKIAIQVTRTSIRDIDGSGGPNEYARKQERIGKAAEETKLIATPSHRLKASSSAEDRRREKNLRSNKITSKGREAHEEALQNSSVAIEVAHASASMVKKSLNRKCKDANDQLQNVQRLRKMTE